MLSAVRVHPAASGLVLVSSNISNINIYFGLTVTQNGETISVLVELQVQQTSESYRYYKIIMSV